MRSLLLLAGLLLCALQAAALEPGGTLPPLRVEDKGELQIEGAEVRFAAWDSSALTHKMHVVQYMAARASSRDLNKPFTDRLKDSGISLERYHVTTIVNLDDAMFGTSGIVVSELEKNKKRYHRSSIVADAQGAGLKAWGLQPKSSAIIILGPDGRVRFFRDGAMSAEEIEHALVLVRTGSDELAAR